MMALERLSRRRFVMAACCVASGLGGSHLGGRDSATPDPWSAAELMEPVELARLLQRAERQLHIVCVTFPVLYRQRHIQGAVLAGPGGKPEGLASLHSTLAPLAKSDAIVLYCGCCPMPKCPNIRPAYVATKQLGFGKVHVLNLPTNLHTDWVVKKYPVES